MEISHSSFYHGVTIGSYEKLKLIWTGWFASSKHNGPSSAKARCNLMFLRAGRMVLSPEPTCNSGHDCQGMQTAQQEHKAPSITSSNPKPQAGQTTASAWEQSRLHCPKAPLPVTQHRFVPGWHGAEPSVPIVSATFPKQKPSQLWCPGQLPLLRAWKTRPTAAPSHTVGVWCHWWDLASAAPSQLQLLGAAPWNKSAGTARRSCTVKWMRVTAASLQCGLESRWEGKT